MKSKTKNRLSENKIKELVRIHFGRECVTGEITELTGGMFNAIYRIERKNEKDAVILKVGVIPDATLLTYERDIMPVEVECYRMIREQTTVPVPEVVSPTFWYCANSAPASATIALAMHSPKVVVKAGSIEEELTMSRLSPVARIDSPSCVRKNTTSSAAHTATITAVTTSLL